MEARRGEANCKIKILSAVYFCAILNQKYDFLFVRLCDFCESMRCARDNYEISGELLCI